MVIHKEVSYSDFKTSIDVLNSEDQIIEKLTSLVINVFGEIIKCRIAIIVEHKFQNMKGIVKIAGINFR